MTAHAAGGASRPNRLGVGDVAPGELPISGELWSTIELDLVAGQTVAVIVDGYNGTGEFMLSITQI